jgi:hypothetical protein
MKTSPVYVVYWKDGGASGWCAFNNRSKANTWSKKWERTVKRICAVPTAMANRGAGSEVVADYLREFYPECLGEA